MSNFLKEYEALFNSGFKMDEAPVGTPPATGQQPTTPPVQQGPKPLDQQAIKSKAAALTSAKAFLISLLV